MSVDEILQQIPRLSLSERRLLTDKLLELERSNDALEIADRLTDNTVQILDRMEEHDGIR